MDLSPYLKLLLEKEADCLILKANKEPSLRLLDQEKVVGNTVLTTEFMNQFIATILNENQQKDIDNYKTVRLAYNSSGKTFIVQADKESDESITVLITLDKRSEKAQIDLSNVQVLGETPDPVLDIMPYLIEMVKLDASDLFITVGSTIKAKISGVAIELDKYLLTPELAESAAFSIMDENQKTEFTKTKDLDFAINLEDCSARFRVNAFYQRKTVGLVLRLIPSIIPKPKDLGLPDTLSELILAKRGLLLLVGGTGSGKSTSLAAMINHRNANSAGHILTIEDPVEFSHPNLKSIVNQREVGIDTESYASALKASLREAPDVILIGEIRDRETMSAALELANTGHLCISTLHANNANQAMERIINMFPQVEHKQLFMDLAINMNSVISQRLIPTPDGKRCAAIEVLINTPHISSLILKGDLNEIKEAMKSSGSKGMKTFDDALYDLYQAQKISMEEALKNADSRNDLEAKINFG
ncbi:MAG: PilT/PilU family type 4a pilus ATPase [Methylococcales bacterium]|nr:PilT/PilU family type 4a pilus ATPase [Methylococcales bacterium]